MPAETAVLENVVRALHADADDVAHLGTGGFASTFWVRRGGDVFAVKVVDPTVASVERVMRELAALQRVDHPNVVRYRAFGDHDYEGTSYRWIAMDYVEGRSLTSILQEGPPPALPDAVALLRDAVAGAAAIWAAGTAHRDLSPNNLLVTDDGRTIIVDLGMARHVDDETITMLPTPGTPGWMSPEQVGASPKHGDWRSDQFVLGLVGYVLLAGTSPFRVTNRAELWQAPAQQTARPIRAVNPDVPSVVAEVIERMLQRGPHRRYLQRDTLLADLDRAVAALAVRTATTDRPLQFHLAIGQLKSYATEVFLQSVRPTGIVLDARARARISEFSAVAAGCGAVTAIDPVTYLARSPREVRPAQYRKLTHGEDPVLTGFPDERTRREWCADVLDGQLAERVDAVVAPYFYAGSGERSWIQESVRCAREVRDLVRERTEVGTSPLPVWTAVAVAQSWLAVDTDRDELLTEITAEPTEALYLLVATQQPSFGPLADLAVLRGFRDVFSVMREAGVPVITARRGSSGLLLLALGATAWTTGVSSNLTNMEPHPEVAQTGGPGYDRIYLPQLLTHLAAPTYAIMREAAPELVIPATLEGRGLLEANPDLTDLTTAQRELLLQHNIRALREQVTELDGHRPGQRIAVMRRWIATAQDIYANLPETRQPGEHAGFLDTWDEVLSTV